MSSTFELLARRNVFLFDRERFSVFMAAARSRQRENARPAPDRRRVLENESSLSARAYRRETLLHLAALFTRPHRSQPKLEIAHALQGPTLIPAIFQRKTSK